jgi:hypothetical protein
VITRYRVLAERIRGELQTLEQVVERAEGAVAQAAQQPENQGYFIAAAALDLHGFYAGLERLFELIAIDIDGSPPTGSRWHRHLLEQMGLAVTDVRPAILLPETRVALMEYLEFRHVVRNVYTFNLRSERVIELVATLRPAFDLTQRDLLSFSMFLDELAETDDG